MDDASRLYAARKSGQGMTRGYILSSFSPLIILIIVTAALSFALSFIFSMSSEIERMLAVLGSGSVRCSVCAESSLLPDGSEISEVRTGNGLIYAENGECAVAVKGTDSDYFSGMRGDELELTFSNAQSAEGGRAPLPAVLSSSLADELSLETDDRFTLLLWEEELGRARPVLCSVSAIFASVYPQLDSHLLYIPLAELSSASYYEVLLPSGADADAAAETLWRAGIPASSYKDVYSSLYMNVRASISILYPILAAIAVLAAFFSSDAAQIYLSRDREDIKVLMMLGMSRRAVRGIYLRITVMAVAAAAFIGIIIGSALSLLSPLLLEAAARREPEMLSFYVTSFTPVIPLPALLFMAVLLILVSVISVSFSLRRRLRR